MDRARELGAVRSSAARLPSRALWALASRQLVPMDVDAIDTIIDRHDPAGKMDRAAVRAIVAEALAASHAAAEAPQAGSATGWSGFFKKTIPERQQQVVSLWPDVDPSVLNSGGLSVDNADSMVENCIG